MVSPGAARQRLRDALILGEIAVTLALLVGAGLLLRSFLKLQRAGIEVDSHNLLTMSISLPEANYPGLAAAASSMNCWSGYAGHQGGISGALDRNPPGRRK